YKSLYGENAGGVGDEAQLTADLVGPPGEHPRAVTSPRLRHHLLGRPAFALADPLDPPLPADQLEQHPGFQVVIPRVQGARPGGLADAVPVLPHPGHDDPAPVAGGEAAVASHDFETGREPLDVPLPRTGKGLVEVVD